MPQPVCHTRIYLKHQSCMKAALFLWSLLQSFYCLSPTSPFCTHFPAHLTPVVFYAFIRAWSLKPHLYPFPLSSVPVFVSFSPAVYLMPDILGETRGKMENWRLGGGGGGGGGRWSGSRWRTKRKHREKQRDRAEKSSGFCNLPQLV